MNNEITHEEKLEFYKTYTSKEFQENYKNVDKVTRKLFFLTILILPVVSIVLGIFNPWLFLSLIPSFAIPFSISSIESKKRNKLIGSINKKFKYDDICSMIENGEWDKLGYELSAREMKINHYAENSELIIEEENTKEEKIKNVPRSLNCCIINEDDDNLVKKTKKRHKKENLKTKTVVKNTFKEEDFNLTHSLLDNFIKEHTNFTLAEYFPCTIFNVDKIYTVILKTPSGVELEFLLSYDYFACIDFSIDFTNNWITYLNNQHSNENNI